MRRRLADESGMTLMETLVVIALLGILMAGLANIFVSGTRAGSDANARLAAQQDTRTALSRFEYEARCSSQATLVSSGAGVALTLPSVCSHVSGTVTWCVSSGVLTRYSGSSCSGTGMAYIRSVTTATPFSCVAPVGPLPKVRLNIGVNTTGRSSDGVTVLQDVTLRNAQPTTSTTVNCS